jgi:hypothetical protein
MDSLSLAKTIHSLYQATDAEERIRIETLIASYGIICSSKINTLNLE